MFGQLSTVYVHRPGHNTRRRRLLHTDLARAQSGPQGPDRRVRCPASLVGGTGHRSSTRPGVIGLCLGSYWPSMCIAKGLMRRGGGCINRLRTFTECPPGPRQVCQMPHIFGWGHGPSIQHQRRGSSPLFGQLLALYVHRSEHNTRRWRLLQTDPVRVQDGLR